MKFGNLSDWEGLITDNAVSPAALAALRRARVKVIRAMPRKAERNGVRKASERV
jgi:hypothetical protein